MFNLNSNMFLVFIVLLEMFTIAPVTSQWEYAVTTSEKIIFYDKTWTEITSAAHQFEEISAIASDEAAEQIYFSDSKHNNGSIFALTLSRTQDEYHLIEKIIPRTVNEYIQGIAFDQLARTIYWSDASSLKIYRMRLDDDNKNPNVVYDFSNEKIEPDSLAIDVCRRKLYWTTAKYRNGTIETSTLDGADRKILINENLSFPRGIVVDQYTKRIYWANKLGGSHFSIESCNMDGTDRLTLLESLNQSPSNLAVNKDFIYWTDTTHSAIWSIFKNSTNSRVANKTKALKDKPNGIICRTDLLKLENFPPCSNVVKRIKKQSSSLTDNNKQPKLSCPKATPCLNNGIINPSIGNCLCLPGFSGKYCEINECSNYCVHGTCSITPLNSLKCDCHEGYTGQRCDIDKCNSHCLNNGTCLIVRDNPVCTCNNKYTGQRCEKNITELCLVFCKYGGYDNEWNLGSACSHMCDIRPNSVEMPVHYNIGDNNNIDNDISNNNETAQSLHQCGSNKFSTLQICIISGSVLIAFTLVYLIVTALRIYKPARPRIKKTFVVHKQTPLTSRPMTTEQCEITIENCCNMNICDTPCFDPNLLQQTMPFANCTKEEDKLINVEDDSS